MYRLALLIHARVATLTKSSIRRLNPQFNWKLVSDGSVKDTILILVANGASEGTIFNENMVVPGGDYVVIPEKKGTEHIISLYAERQE
jgi:hypothetical protein